MPRASEVYFEGALEAAQVVRESNWLVALDLRHGYQQVAMAPEARRYLGARLGDQVLASTVLPFGLNISPYVFTRLTNFLAREVRRRFGLQVAVYVDDFLLGASTREALEKGLEEVKNFFTRLGVVLSDKAPAVVSQRAEFLGFSWDAVAKEVSVSQERRRQYRREVKALLRKPQPRARWRQVVGRLLFLREACGPTLRHVRSLLRVVRGRTEGPVEARGEAKLDLLWWVEKLRGPVSLALPIKPVSASLTTDASDGTLGFSIVTEDSRIEKTLQAQDSRLAINSKELEAILRGLEAGKDLLRGRHVVLYTDNMTARAAVARQGTQRLSSKAWELSKAIVDRAEELGVRFLPRHVPGRLNAHADALSRPLEEREAWEEALRRVTSAWGPLEEDPCGWTGAPTSLLEGCTWAGRRCLLRPQVHQLGKVVELLELVRREPPLGDPSTWESMAVLIAPHWRGATWWTQLVGMRASSLTLGTLPDTHLSRWRARNGHDARWSASLVPTRTLSGQRQR